MATPTPLTTIFTPPSDCLSQLYWSYEGPLQLGSGTECIPPGLSPILHSYFSPGIYCPESWTVACQSEVTLGAVTETRAQCCPRADGIESFSLSSFTCNSVNAADSSSYKSWYESFGCTMNLGTLAAQGYVNVVATGATPYTTTVSFASDGGINAFSVQIAWQASDLVSKTSVSTIPTSTKLVTQNTTEISATTKIPTSYGEAKSHRLSRAAKIAIGVVVPSVVILAIVGALLVSRRRMAKSRLRYVEERAPVPGAQQPQPAPIYEVANEQPRSELPARKLAELSTKEIYELPASKEGVFMGEVKLASQ